MILEMEELMRFELMCIFCDTLVGLVALHQPRSVLSDEEIEQVISSFLIGSWIICVGQPWVFSLCMLIFDLS